MSRVPDSWSMMPAAMNSEALKVAWFITWNTAATAPAGCSGRAARDQAEMAHGGIGQQAFQVVLEDGDVGAEDQRDQSGAANHPHPRIGPANAGHSRTSRNTPSFTIVAECRKADTGVGAAIAWGNQKWNGNCALLVSAPSGDQQQRRQVQRMRADAVARQRAPRRGRSCPRYGRAAARRQAGTGRPPR